VSASTPASADSRRRRPCRGARSICFNALSLASYRGIFDNRLFNDDFSWLRAARYDMTPGTSSPSGRRLLPAAREPLVLGHGEGGARQYPDALRLQLVLHFFCVLLVFHLALKLFESPRSPRRRRPSSPSRASTQRPFSGSARARRCCRPSSSCVDQRAARGQGRKGPAHCVSAASMFSRSPRRRRRSRALHCPPPLRAGRKTRGAAQDPGGRCRRVHRHIGGVPPLPADAHGRLRPEQLGPGGHALRNVGGGFLDQLYPWPFFSLFYRPGTVIPESSSVFSPEIAALPVAGVSCSRASPPGNRAR